MASYKNDNGSGAGSRDVVDFQSGSRKICGDGTVLVRSGTGRMFGAVPVGAGQGGTGGF